MTEIEVGRYALRTFRIIDGNLSPVSITGKHWNNGVCEAACGAKKTHTPPAHDCSCGIYGTLTLSHLMCQYGYLASQLVAVIAAEGNTIIGDKGLRTQYARVVAYWTRSDTPEKTRLRELSHAEKFDDVTEMLKTYGFPTDDFSIDGSPEIPWDFAAAVPDRDTPSNKVFTIFNVKPGTYTEVKLSDGYTIAIAPITFSSDGCLVLSINWIPCTVLNCTGCEGCRNPKP